MIHRETRTLGYYAGSRWLQSAVFFLIVAALVLVLLRAMNEVEAQAERQAVELTLRNMRTGMQFAMAEALMRQRESDMAAWARSNPVRWLEVPPAGYRGECTVDERRDLPEGAWCFERESQELLFRPRNTKQLRRLDDGRQCSQLVWQVTQIADHAPSSGLVGVRIVPTSACGFVDGIEKARK